MPDLLIQTDEEILGGTPAFCEDSRARINPRSTSGGG